jgi:lysylphosphatidylglycerol synthetase-like protein (DUF2156 family)
MALPKKLTIKAINDIKKIKSPYWTSIVMVIVEHCVLYLFKIVEYFEATWQLIIIILLYMRHKHELQHNRL